MAETQKAVFKVFIQGAIQDVWREITKTDEPQQAFFNMQLHTDGLRRGGRMQMRSPNGKYTSVVGEVLEFDPPHRYAHTFRFTQYDDPPCIVRFELKELQGGVEFTMTLEDLPAGTRTAKEMIRGGDMITKNMKAIVETGRPPLWVRMLYTMFKLMEPFSPKRTRSENWPLTTGV